MAWTGTPTIKSLGHNLVRITGVSIGASTTATIGLDGSGKDIELPSTFPSATDTSGLTLADLIEVRYQHTEAGSPGAESRHIHMEKIGTVAADWYILVTNDQNQASSTLDIYVQFHHSLVR